MMKIEAESGWRLEIGELVRTSIGISSNVFNRKF